MLDEIERHSNEEVVRMNSRINTKVDPAKFAAERIFASACRSWATANPTDGRPHNVHTLNSALQLATSDTLDAFHHSFARECYDWQSIFETLDIHGKSDSISMNNFILGHAAEFFSEMLDPRSTCDPIEAQRTTKVSAMAPVEIAEACKRISVASGLPPDGHCILLAHRGQAVYYMNGATGQLQCEAVMGSESAWNLAGSTLPPVSIGESASGKDNIKDVVLEWIKKLAILDLPATTVCTQGKITVQGIMNMLQNNEARGASQLQIINAELEKVLSKKQMSYLQEGDMIELLDGSEAFGKMTQQEVCLTRPNCWMLLCTQPAVYLDEMGTGSKGRLRLTPCDA